MRVLITGAAGYIGRHVVKQVLDMGHEVIASDFRFDGVDPRAEQSRVSLSSLASRMRASIWLGGMDSYIIPRHI